MVSELEIASAEESESRDSHSSLQWIDCSDPGNIKSAKIRRIIHQHSMKDIGKSRRKKLKRQRSERVQLDLSALESANTFATREAQTRPSLWLGTAAGMDPFISYPFELDSAAQELIAVVFQDDGGLQRPLRDAWFAVGLADEAAFLQVLSNSALHLDTLRNGGRRPRESPLSVYYQLRAVRSINERLQDSRAFLSDGSIGTVTGLMCHDEIIGAFDRWVNHYKGIKDMIEQRGGIQAVEGNETLRLTISWVELRGVFPQDLPPAFPIPYQWVEQATLPSLPYDDLLYTSALRRIWSEEMPGWPEWLRIYEALVLFSIDSFPVPVASATLEHTYNGAWTNTIIYRLLKFRPLQQYSISNQSLIQEACRLGSLLYLAPIWRSFGVHPVRSEILVRKLKVLLTSQEVNWGRLWKLQLWVLYMGAMEAQPVDGITWFAEEIASVFHKHGVEEWGQGLDKIKEILWVKTIFDGRDGDLGGKIVKLLQENTAANISLQ